MPGRVVSREEWKRERDELLVKEKQHTRRGAELAVERANMPLVKVDEDYEFTTMDNEKVSLDQMFDGRRQLVVYHVMFAPNWENACHGCSFVVDHMPSHLGSLNSRRTSLVLVSRAPVDKLKGWKERMGWTLPWYSSQGSTFNFDFHATQDDATEDTGDIPGLSVFIRDPDDGSIYHSYSTWSRGLDQLLTTMSLLDFTPLGRQDSEHQGNPAGGKYHDEY